MGLIAGLPCLFGFLAFKRKKIQQYSYLAGALPTTSGGRPSVTKWQEPMQSLFEVAALALDLPLDSMIQKMQILDVSYHPGSSSNGSARALSQWGIRVLRC